MALTEKELWLKFLGSLKQKVTGGADLAVQTIFPFHLWDWGGTQPPLNSIPYTQQTFLDRVPTEPVGNYLDSAARLSSNYKQFLSQLSLQANNDPNKTMKSKAILTAVTMDLDREGSLGKEKTMIRRYFTTKTTILSLLAVLFSCLVPGTANAVVQGGCCATVHGVCVTICNRAGGCTGNADCNVAESKGTLEQIADALTSLEPGVDQVVRRRLALDLGYRVEGHEPVPLRLKLRKGGTSPSHSGDFLGRCPEGTVASPFEMPIYDEDDGLFVVGFKTVWFCIPEDLEPAK